MRPFHTVAVPHDDILKGRLSLDVYAADLWELAQGRASEEYRDRETFFRKTYLTRGLQNLVDEVERRLRGQGGDPVIQLQTPFGGGKTHALIALYHRAGDWGARCAVLVGDALSGDQPLWGVLEEQLTGKRARLVGRTAPGREILREVLEPHQPLLILVDELLQYVTKAAGIAVEASTMAAQTLAFLQELTETVVSLPRACLVVTLPSSVLDQFDENAARFLQQLQKVAGRVERVLTPVAEDEVANVIRRRLFTYVDEAAAVEVVDAYLDYANREGLLPPGREPTEYRRRFLASYPFLPEVIDVLYHRWGSFPTFQRTRGVLRLLALVIHSLRHANLPYITLADFDLMASDIRRELLKHIGNEFDSVIAADITGSEAGSRRTDEELGSFYRGLCLGTRAATVIFMHSFSGGVERGAQVGEIKRHAAVLGVPSAVVAEAVEMLRGKLYYLQLQSDRYFFSNQANLNKIVIDRMETIAAQERLLEETERELLLRALRPQGTCFERHIYCWPESENDGNIDNVSNITLVVLRRKDEQLMRRIVEWKGASPRVYKNTLVFLYPADGERPAFRQELLHYLAYCAIRSDAEQGIMHLTPEQRREVDEAVRRLEGIVPQRVRMLYRLVALPGRDGFREIDLGVPTIGDSRGIAAEIHDKLRAEQEILESVHPTVLKAKYLRDRAYVSTVAIYEAALRTPGEVRWVDRSVVERAIVEGVQQGIFGLAELVDGAVRIRAYRTATIPAFTDNEVIVCDVLIKDHGNSELVPSSDVKGGYHNQNLPKQTHEITTGTVGAIGPSESRYEELRLCLRVPRGRVSNLLGLLHFLQERFNRLEVEIRCSEGTLARSEYEERILEALRQAGLEKL